MAETTRQKQRTGSLLVLLVAITVINALLSRFAVVAWPDAPGVSSVYFAVAFMIPFTLWFGAWGAVSAYVACVIGAGLPWVPLGVNLYWSLADLWQVLIPLVAFKRLHAYAGLRTLRDLVVFFVFGWLLNNLAGALWGSTMLSVGGVLPRSEVPGTFVSWLVSNLIVTLAISVLLLKYATPLLVQRDLLIGGYWS